ncbi:Cu,Zn superoxide dismutase-like protein [Lentithecium fluviatile CBS 122367]|uniref:superoxide dismutase n=1 Tax=Lentithecium fluviatile CBS 122367 TaxID=1168545 RepID=A0A6G1JL92_9PLEO|nr:Cu,Zn superoxide dismutase-like protein [Lentithecium fluviatile CBS 122367]
MRTQSILSVLAVATAATAQTLPAPVIESNPVGAQYLAVLPDKSTTTLRGSLQIQSSADGKGVDISVAVSGLPAEGGPFMYHIHEKPVPTDGNCTGTGAHLDPYKRGEAPICDASKPETCQTGDLSGKHGNITARDFSAKYTDLFLATKEDPSYFGKLSVVFHLSNKTRISCANFTLNAPGAGVTPLPSSGYALPTGTGTGTGGHGGHNSTVTSTATATGTGSTTGTVMVPTASPSQAPPESSNAAQKLVAGAGALAFAAAALVL